jgi:hypothetical protein
MKTVSARQNRGFQTGNLPQIPERCREEGINYSFEELWLRWLRTLANRLVDFFNID